VDETLWPEFLELSNGLQTYLDKETERHSAQSIHADEEEEEVIAGEYLG